jgi:hypothetical protein
VVDFTVTAPGTFAGDLTGAGNDCDLRDESPDHIYEIILPEDGEWTFSLCDPIPDAWDSVIYLGTECCTDDITSNDDGCAFFGLSEIVMELTAGTYYLTIEGFGDTDFGAYELSVTLPTVSFNDLCDDAHDVTDGQTAFNLAGATTTGENEPTCAFPFGGAANQQINQDLWYTYEATCTGDLFIDTCEGGNVDTRLAIYDGCDCPPAGDPLECNDDDENATEADSGRVCPGTYTLASSLSVPVVSGNCYTIRVGSFSTSGTINGDDLLTISCGAPPAPAPPMMGDFDGDFDVDLADYAALQNCASSFGAGCDAFDLDQSGSVDADDVTAFTKMYHGPESNVTIVK